jgi:hypothetical protein
MARIILGLGTSHSPQLSTPPELWPLHGERDKRNPQLLDTTGSHVSYEELLAKAEPSLAKEVTPEKWQARHEACQRGITKLAETLAQVSPDVVVMLGDDQEELFSEDNMPAMLVYWGETSPAATRSRATLPCEHQLGLTERRRSLILWPPTWASTSSNVSSTKGLMWRTPARSSLAMGWAMPSVLCTAAS